MAKESKSPVWKFRMTVAALVCCVFLGFLGQYLWNFEYKIVIPKSEAAAVPLQPMLRVGDGTEFQRPSGLCACFSLVNISSSKVRLIDTVLLEPLYDVKLTYRAPDGSVTPAPMTSQHLAGTRTMAQAAKGFDPEADGLVELVTGAALTRVIPLASRYDLRREGKYDLVVTYQPGALVQPSDTQPPELKVYSGPVSCPLSFEIPLKKAAGGTGAPPAVEKPAPAPVEKVP